MPLPPGISLSTITFGTALTNVKRTDLGMRVTFTPTTNLVWAATGTVIIALAESATTGSDGNGSITLIDPWQPGFVDGRGNSIINWGYTVKAEYLDSGRTVLTSPNKIVTWTQDASTPIDLDLLIPVESGNGIIVSLPDMWTAQIADLTARVAALESGTPNPGTFTQLSTVGGDILTTVSGDIIAAA